MIRVATEGTFGADANPVMQWLPAEGYLRTEYTAVQMAARHVFEATVRATLEMTVRSTFEMATRPTYEMS